jgi:LPXTG-motif cell wall-anchored protein
MWRERAVTGVAKVPSGRVPARSRTATLAATAMLALSPAAALAQNGAGDQQYSDPFSGQSAPSTPKPHASPTQASPAPAQQAQASPSVPTTTATAPATGAPAAQLPRTGFDVVPLALLGAALIGAGLLLLRRRGAHGGD